MLEFILDLEDPECMLALIPVGVTVGLRLTEPGGTLIEPGPMLELIPGGAIPPGYEYIPIPGALGYPV